MATKAKIKNFTVSTVEKTVTTAEIDDTIFYVSDTELILRFSTKEEVGTFDKAELVLHNLDDKTLVTVPMKAEGPVYEYVLTENVIEHFGDWQAQLILYQDDELLLAQPAEFTIENDLSNKQPPQLIEVNSWKNLKKLASQLIVDIKEVIQEGEKHNALFDEAENQRALRFTESMEVKDTTFQKFVAESRNKHDNEINTEISTFRENMERYENAFNGNENDRIQTFSSNENARKEQELEREQAEAQRQQAESQRQSTFETNESQRQNTFETAEQSRESAEAIRAENEQARNMTSVEEFTKLQDAIGGRNMVGSTIAPFSQNNAGTGLWQRMTDETGNFIRLTPNVDRPVSTYLQNTNIVYLQQTIPNEQYTWSLEVRIPKAHYVSFYNNAGRRFLKTENEWVQISFTDIETIDKKIIFGLNYSEVGTYIDYRNLKLEKGAIATPYTKAPEDYKTVSKDDYYNHIKLMTDFKDNKTKLAIDMAGKVKIANAFINGGFSNGTIGWMTSPGYRNTFEVIDGVAKNIDVATENHRSFIYENSKVPIGHITYHAFRYKQTGITNNRVGVLYSLTGIDLQQYYYPTNEDFNVYTGMGVSSGNNRMRLIVSNIVAEGEYNVYLDYFLMLDLTDIFGAGNEPSKATMDWIINTNGYFEELTLSRDTIQNYEMGQIKKAVIALGGTI